MGCSSSAVLLVMLGNMIPNKLMTATGWFGVYLAVTLFMPIRFIWYLAMAYPILTLLSLAQVALGNSILAFGTLLPACLYGMVMLLLARPASRRFYGFHT